MAWPEQQQLFPTLYSGFMIFSLSRFAASAPSSLSFFLAGCGAGQRLRPPSAAPLHLPGRRVRRPPPRAAAVSTACRLDIVASLPFPSPPPQFPSPLQRLIPSSRFLSEMAEASTGSPKSVHDFTVKDARGNDVDLSTYKGKVLLIVNVASQCGLTNSNYTELSQLYEKYKEKDFEILAFPCNQFNGQEPGSNEEILEFACTRFKAEYPIFDKVDVNGENSAPIYKFLKKSKGGLLGSSIKWNFSKFLIDKEGTVVDRYAPTTAPLSIEKDIKKLLGL